MKEYFQIELRNKFYGETVVYCSNTSKNEDFKEFNFSINSQYNSTNFVEKKLGKRYFNMYIEGDTIFRVSKNVYKKIQEEFHRNLK